jgi:uncharacterized 2Fe-2S/4Fe-4S cluster protein (DUF4445 family)
MTSTEYTTRRESLVAQLASRKAVTVGDRSVTNRDIKEIQLAINALDAEWQRSQGTATARIGRMYISGEGR